MKLRYKLLLKHWLIGITILMVGFILAYIFGDVSNGLLFIDYLWISFLISFWFTSTFSLIDYFLYFRSLEEK